MGPFPESLRTARLTLRLADEELAAVEHEMVIESLDHLWPWFPHRASPPTLEDRVELAARQRAAAAAGTEATYLVFAGDRAVGKVWFELEGSTARMGWYLRAGETGHGYGTEAVRALAELGVEAGIERIEAHTDPDNVASRALAERAGFVLEEIRPDAYQRADGVRRPECLYVLPRGRADSAGSVGLSRSLSQCRWMSVEGRGPFTSRGARVGDRLDGRVDLPSRLGPPVVDRPTRTDP